MAAIDAVDEAVLIAPERWRGTPRIVRPLCRRHQARRIPGVTSRVVRPTPKTSEPVPSNTKMMESSQANRRIVSGANSCPVSRDDPAPGHVRSSSRSTVTNRAAFRVVGAPPPAAEVYPSQVERRTNA